MGNAKHVDTPFTVGASRFGASFLGLWRECPMKWFNTHKRPHPDGGVGLEPGTTGEALLFGWAIHEGLAAYYRSGWEAGTYDIELAVVTVRSALVSRANEFLKAWLGPRSTRPCRQPQLNAVTEKAIHLLRDYHSFYRDEFPSLRVLGDGRNEPYIEREFEVPLGYKDYIFTSRFDGLCRFGDHVYALEHKTTSASRVSALLLGMGMNAQVSGQVYILSQLFPEWKIHGTLVNVLVKDRSPKNPAPAFKREVATRVPLDLEKFRLDAVRSLVQIEEACDHYEGLVDSGMDVDDAARQAFAMHTNQCVVFGQCQYYGMCKSLGFESKMIGDFKPRVGP